MFFGWQNQRRATRKLDLHISIEFSEIRHKSNVINGIVDLVLVLPHALMKAVKFVDKLVDPLRS